ncbi:unnamed protein product [Coregonus sp. 'balchen']|nr:unnamed protein product [Coregonus sp. 'balchen']
MELDNDKPRKKKRPHWIVRGLGPSFTACMGFVISVLYITFPCAWLATHVSVAYPVASAMLLTGTLVTFLVSSFMDPGILHQDPPWPGTAEVAYVIVNGQKYEMDWCSRCELYLPPAAWHCRRCNACVDLYLFLTLLILQQPFSLPHATTYLGAVKPSRGGDTEGDWSRVTPLHQEDLCLYSYGQVSCCNTCKHHKVAVGPASRDRFKHNTLSLDSLKEGRGSHYCYRKVEPAGCVITDKHSNNKKPSQSSAVEIPDIAACW